MMRRICDTHKDIAWSRHYYEHQNDSFILAIPLMLLGDCDAQMYNKAHHAIIPQVDFLSLQQNVGIEISASSILHWDW